MAGQIPMPEVRTRLGKEREMKPKYDNEVKFKVMRDHKTHPELTIPQLATLNNCSNSSVSNWLKCADDYKFRNGELHNEKRERIIEHFNRDPSKTQKQIGIECSCSGTMVSKTLTVYFESRRRKLNAGETITPETIQHTTQDINTLKKA